MAKNLNVRFEDDDLHERVVAAARRNARSVNSQILTTLNDCTPSGPAPVHRPITITLNTLGEILEKAAERGLEVGRKGTEGDYTAAGIAVHVLMDENLLPARDATTKTQVTWADATRTDCPHVATPTDTEETQP